MNHRWLRIVVRKYCSTIINNNNRLPSDPPIDLHFKLFEPPSGTTTTTKSLIILPGFLGSSRNWSTIGKRFARDLQCPVYALDLRNHGKSTIMPEDGPKEAFPMTWSAYIGDLRKFIHDRQLSNVTLLGHSFGGQVAMKTVWSQHESAALSPSNSTLSLSNDQIKRLIVVDIAPKPLQFEGSSVEVLLRAMIEVEREGYTRRSEAEAHLGAFESNPVILHFLLSSLHPATNGGRLRFALPLEVLHQGMLALSRSWNSDAPPPVQPIDGLPCLFVRGQRSEYIGEADYPLVERIFRRSEIVTVPGAGHWVHFDQPETFATLLTDWIVRQINE